MANPSLSELIEDTERIITRSDDLLARSISKVQGQLFREIRDILRSFQDSDFRLSTDAADSRLFYELRRKLNQILASSDYTDSIQAYLTAFDEVEPLAKELIAIGANKTTAGRVMALNMAIEKEMIAGSIANNLLAKTSIENTFIAPLQRMIYTNVTGRVTYNEAEAKLREYLTNTPGKQNGFLLRYVQQISRDGINQFQGAINQKAVNQIGLDGFEYVGSLLSKDSRQNCIDLVNGTGPFAQFAVRPRLYRVSDLPAIIALAEDRPGWISGTTPATFFINRGGYNCRHRAIAKQLPKNN